MRNTLLLVLLLGSWFSSVTMADTAVTYSSFKQAGLDKRQLVQADISPLLQQLPATLVETTLLGHSVQGRAVYQLRLGQGPVNIMAWSQMHGDESTATASLMDLLAYLQTPEGQQWYAGWQQQFSLYLIPMLNPDGAEAGTRVNAAGVDLNRDAKSLVMPESQLLMAAAKRIQPKLALNLHDQNRTYAVGTSLKTATISLLAPPYDYQNSAKTSRLTAMQLIAEGNAYLQQHIPGHVARYDDSYSIRSFGDTFSEMGISTVLIEAGAYAGDDTRQQARQRTFELIRLFIDSLSSQNYLQYQRSDYDAIAFNRDGGIKDLIVQQVSLPGLAKPVSLAVEFGQQSRFQEIGDLSIFGSFHQLESGGASYVAGKAFELTAPLLLNQQKYQQLLAQGYSHFTGAAELLKNESGWPVVLNPTAVPEQYPQRGQLAV